MSWTPERIGNLESLWAEGHSTAEIGRRLGVSKNAVVGKAHRLGLPGRQSPIDAKRRQAKKDAAPAATARTTTPRTKAAPQAAPAAAPTAAAAKPRAAAAAPAPAAATARANGPLAILAYLGFIFVARLRSAASHIVMNIALLRITACRRLAEIGRARRPHSRLLRIVE